MIFALRGGIFAIILDGYVMVLSRYTYFNRFCGVLGAPRVTPDPSLAAGGLRMTSGRSCDLIQFSFFFTKKKGNLAPCLSELFKTPLVRGCGTNVGGF